MENFAMIFRHLGASALLVSACVSSAYGETTFSVLGDSYSTFEGHVTPKWNDIWYSDETQNKFGNDVTEVEDTWWKLLDSTAEYALEVNNSWSGSTICNIGYHGADYSDRSFITRVHNLGAPDIILIFGGTNDSWADAPIGEYKYEGWNEKDLYSFRPAFAYLLDELKSLYPGASIVNILNSELKPEINESVATICNHYAVPNIVLEDIVKESGHPSREGMTSVFRQVKSALDRL